MRKIFFIAVALIFCISIRCAAQDGCVKCHIDVDDEPTRAFKKDVHFAAGLSCADCHGGNRNTDDMDAAMNKVSGFIGIPAKDKISQTCAKCHSDAEFMKKFNPDIKTGQLEKLKIGVHGKLTVKGTEMILQCTSCHKSHGIQKVKSPGSSVYAANIPALCNNCHGNAAYMQMYNPSLPVDQLTKYRTSRHGILNAKGSSKAADCSDCHGSHDIFSSKDVRSLVYKTNIPSMCGSCHSNSDYMNKTSLPLDQYDKYMKSAHGVAVFEKKDLSAPVCNDCHGNHGANPPGIESISKVCGSCHALNADLFAASPHKKAFDERNYPECETCHGNHEILTAKDDLLGVGNQSICITCHKSDDNSKGYLIAMNMRRLIDSLGVTDTLARQLIFRAEQKGMEIEEAKFMLKDIHQAELESRTIVHSFNEDEFLAVVQKGFDASNFVIEEANAAIEEYYFRRTGLIVAVGIITFLVILLYLYIKKIEKVKTSD